jgi:hypothetical protein
MYFYLKLFNLRWILNRTCASVSISKVIGYDAPRSIGTEPNSLAGLVTRLLARRSGIEVRFPAGGRCVSLYSVEAISGSISASYPIGTGGSFTGGKAAGACNLPPASIQRRGQEYLEFCPQSSMCLYGMALN